MTIGKTTARRWVARTIGVLVAVAGVGVLGAGQGFAAGSTLTVTSVYFDNTAADHQEGVTYPAIAVASFTDSDACPTPTTCQPASDYKARILWGDGSPTATLCPSAGCTITFGSVTGTTGTYNIAAGHAFADEKSSAAVPSVGFTIHVVVNDSVDAVGTGANGSDAANFGVSVTDQPIGPGSTNSFSATVNAPFSGQIGSFQDANEGAVALDEGNTSAPEYTFPSGIDWGDGTPLDTTTASFTIGACGTTPGLGAGQGCQIMLNGGPHTYTAAGSYTVTVVVNDGIRGNTATFSSTANVTVNNNLSCTTATTTLLPFNPTVAVGGSQTFTATSTACSAPKFQFWLQYPAGTGTFHVVQAFSVGTNSWTWDTSTSPYNTPGNYRIVVWANQTGHQQTSYEAYAQTYPTLAILNSCTTATTTLLPSNPILATGASQTFTATSTACPAPKFQFWIQYPAGTGTFHIVQAFSIGTNTWTWNTALAPYNKPGAYRIVVWANQTGHSQSTFEAYAQTYPTLTGCTAASVTWSVPSPQASGTPITATGHSATCATPKYEFWVQAPGTSTWTDAQPYSNGSATFLWVTTGKPKGVYHFSIWVRDANSGGAAGDSLGTWDSYTAPTYTLT